MHALRLSASHDISCAVWLQAKAGVFIWLHRDPQQVVGKESRGSFNRTTSPFSFSKAVTCAGSCCSMNQEFREYMSADFESPKRIGARTLRRLSVTSFRQPIGPVALASSATSPQPWDLYR